MKLRYTDKAADEFEVIIDGLAKVSPQGATNVRRRMYEMLLHILQNPRSGRLTSSGLRRIPTPPYPYLIFYDIKPEEVTIIGIRHSARDPASMPGGTEKRR